MPKYIAIPILCLAMLVIPGMALALDHQDNSVAAEPPTEVVPTEIIQLSQRPQLTEQQREKVLKIISEDKIVNQILRDMSYQVDKVGSSLLLDENDTYTLIGGSVLISFNVPVVVERDWPKSTYNGEGFESKMVHEEVLCDHLSIRVDLTNEQVVHITPWNFENRELERSMTESLAEEGK